MPRTVTFQGGQLTLEGEGLKIGDRAPDFSALDADLKEVKLSDFAGKIRIVSVTPSLDTPVCDLQLRWFNTEASSLGADVVVLNISMDLPFAIARFCTSAGIDKVKALSDHRTASFGRSYGLLIKELRLLTRAVLIIDRDDVLRYQEIVPEITNQPDYDRALEALKTIV